MVANTPGRYGATSAFETKKAMATVRARQQVFRFQVLRDMDASVLSAP